LAAGDGLGITVTRGQELNGFGERRRACIVEGRQFHDSVASFGTQRRERYLSSQPRMGQRDRAAAANGGHAARVDGIGSAMVDRRQWSAFIVEGAMFSRVSQRHVA
jgi:hypothetical protein